MGYVKKPEAQLGRAGMNGYGDYRQYGGKLNGFFLEEAPCGSTGFFTIPDAEKPSLLPKSTSLAFASSIWKNKTQFVL
jgi:hypothetical protein